MDISETAQQKGTEIFINITHMLSECNMTQADLARRIERSPDSFSKLLYDLKKGQISLKNLLLIAHGLGIGEDITQLVKKPIHAIPDISVYQAEILEITARMAVDTIFELNQLLYKYWHQLSYTERQRLGKEFYRQVKEGFYPHVSFFKKRSDNHALYKIR